MKIDEKNIRRPIIWVKKNDSIDWKLIGWKLDKIGLELVKNMRRFGKKKCGLGSCTSYTTCWLGQLQPQKGVNISITLKVELCSETPPKCHPD